MTAERCPHCLNLPLSQSVACQHCGGTGLFRLFPRPRHIERLSYQSWHGAECPVCSAIKQHQSWYPRNDPQTLVEHVVCACGVDITRTPFNTEQFYLQLFRNNPNHPINYPRSN